MAKKYGYKPKAVSIEGMSGEQIQAMRKSPAVRLFRVAFGRHEGETRMGDGIPWAGATEGATNTEEAIAKLEAINPTVAANCKKFADAATKSTGKRRVKYHEDGVVVTIPTAAADRGVAAGTMTVVGVA